MKILFTAFLFGIIILIPKIAVSQSQFRDTFSKTSFSSLSNNIDELRIINLENRLTRLEIVPINKDIFNSFLLILTVFMTTLIACFSLTPAIIEFYIDGLYNRRKYFENEPDILPTKNYFITLIGLIILLAIIILQAILQISRPSIISLTIIISITIMFILFRMLNFASEQNISEKIGIIIKSMKRYWYFLSGKQHCEICLAKLTSKNDIEVLLISDQENSNILICRFGHHNCLLNYMVPYQPSVNGYAPYSFIVESKLNVKTKLEELKTYRNYKTANKKIDIILNDASNNIC